MKKATVIFWIILLCGVLVLSVHFWGQSRVEKTKAEFEEKIQKYESRIEELEKMKDDLTAEIARLDEKLLDAKASSGKEVANSQIMNDLKTIFHLYKTGRSQEAKEQFLRIPEMGFDDATYDYYQVLKELLN